MNKTKVYRNSRLNKWSVKFNNGPVKHFNELSLSNATFHVQPAGRQKVLKTKRKNVHAYVSGTFVYTSHLVYLDTFKYRRVRYNPYYFDKFFYDDNLERVSSAKIVYFTDKGEVYVNA